MPLEQLFRGSMIDIHAVRERMLKTAADLGLPFGESGMLYNTRLAQELGLWAETKGRGDAYHTAAFRAYFVDGKNIADIPVLIALAESAGLAGNEAEEVLVSRSFKAAVDEDWAVSRALEITAVPTFIANGNRLVGAQPYEALQALMQSGGIGKRQ